MYRIIFKLKKLVSSSSRLNKSKKRTTILERDRKFKEKRIINGFNKIAMENVFALPKDLWRHAAFNIKVSYRKENL